MLMYADRVAGYTRRILISTRIFMKTDVYL
jgi:hypothetical protein